MCVSFALINQKNNIIGHFLWTFADLNFDEFEKAPAARLASREE